MYYTRMYGLKMINLLVCTHNGGSPVTLSIGLQIPVGVSPKHLSEVYTPVGGSPI